MLSFVDSRVEDGPRSVFRLSAWSTKYPESGTDWIPEGCKGGLGSDRLFSSSRGRGKNLGENIRSSQIFAKDWERPWSFERDSRVLVRQLGSRCFGVIPGRTRVFINEDLELGIQRQLLKLVLTTIEYLGCGNCPCVFIHKRLKLLRVSQNGRDKLHHGYIPF